MKRLLYARSTYVWLAVLMPLWVAFGRFLFGVYGWYGVIYTFAIPVMWIFTLGISLGFFFRRDVRASHAIGKADAYPQLVLYGYMFLYGIFLVDFGDAEGSDNSILVQLTSRSLIPVSHFLAALCVVTIIGAVGWCIVRVILSYRRLPPKP